MSPIMVDCEFKDLKFCFGAKENAVKHASHAHNTAFKAVKGGLGTPSFFL